MTSGGACGQDWLDARPLDFADGLSCKEDSPMEAASILRWVLRLKVLFTVLGWALPLFLLSPDGFKELGFLEPPPRLFARLLGAAFVALVVEYLQGLRDLGRGRDVTNVVWVGIVSNGLGCLVLLASGLGGAWDDWGEPAVSLLWASAAITGAITLGLAGAGLWAGGAAGGQPRTVPSHLPPTHR
jgi:hypothetical protein